MIVDGWVIDILKVYGLAGVVIVAQAGVIVALWRRLSTKDDDLVKLNAERAGERETLVKLIEGGNLTALATANATSERNKIMEELGKALAQQAGAVDRYEDRVKNQAEMIREKLETVRHVVDAFGEAHRVNSGLTAEVRNMLGQLHSAVNGVAIAVASSKTNGTRRGS